jgi:hypothetical protein
MLTDELYNLYELYLQGNYKAGKYENEDDLKKVVDEEKPFVLEGRMHVFWFFTFICLFLGSIVNIFIQYAYENIIGSVLSIVSVIGAYFLLYFLKKFRKTYLLIFNQQGLYFRRPFKEIRAWLWKDITKLDGGKQSSLRHDSYYLIWVHSDLGKSKITPQYFKNREFDGIEFEKLLTDLINLYWEKFR